MTGSDNRPKVGVIGYDHKFISPILGYLARNGYSIDAYEWEKYDVDDADRTRTVIGNTDVIVAEWLGRNAVEAVAHRAKDQPVIVRMHRFELYRNEWANLDIEAVSTVIAVGEEYRRRLLARTGWPPEKVIVIPNPVDLDSLDLPKRNEADFTIGMLGVASERKRLDLALDVFEQVLERDDRYRLQIKSARPQSLKWVWDSPTERAFARRVDERLQASPLREVVSWIEPGPDVAGWLQGIGYLLSTSDDESFHLSPAEGAASGAVPIVRNWPGASEIHPDGFVGSIDELPDLILGLAGDRDRARRKAREFVRNHYDIEVVGEQWARLIDRLANIAGS
jgi:glycosyltransferase involved in cell wall biosynthesis